MKIKSIIIGALLALLSSPCFAWGVIGMSGGASGTPAEWIEGFEATGYDQSGWTEYTNGGTVDEDYTTVHLIGSQSLGITGNAGGDYAKAILSFTAENTHYAAFECEIYDGNHLDDNRLFEWRDASNNVLAYGYISWSTDHYVLNLRAEGSPSSQYGEMSISEGTPFYIWTDMTIGTGANATCNVYYSATATKPVSPTLTDNAGTTMAQPGQFVLEARFTDIVVFDQVHSKSSAIGNLQ